MSQMKEDEGYASLLKESPGGFLQLAVGNITLDLNYCLERTIESLVEGVPALKVMALDCSQGPQETAPLPAFTFEMQRRSQMATYEEFIDLCMDGFREIQVEVDNIHRQYMLKRFNLLFLQFEEGWTYLDRTDPKRKKRVKVLAAKARELQELIEADSLAYSEIMFAAYRGEIDQENYNDFISWLDTFQKGADVALQMQKTKTPKGGPKSKQHEAVLVQCMATFFEEIALQKVKTNHAIPGKTEFSKFANYVLGRLGLSASESSIYRAFKKSPTVNN